MTLKELREKRKNAEAKRVAAKAAIDALIAESDKNEGVMSAEQSSQLETLEANYETARNHVAALDRQIAREQHPTTATPVGVTHQAVSADGAIESPEITDMRDLAAERSFGSFGEFLRCVAQAGSPNPRIDPRLLPQQQRPMGAASGASEGIDADGGFLVQTDMATTIMQRTYEAGVLSSRVTKLPLSGSANSISIPAVDETSRANGSRYGGVQVYWADEAATVTASKPKIRRARLELHKIMGLCYATDELIQDASALEALIMKAFPEEFAFKVDDAILNGTGSGQPLGILNAGSLVTVSKETGQAAASVVFNNITKMWARLYAKSRPRSAWFINQDIEPALQTMSLAVGTGGVPVYLPANGLAGSPYGTLMGRPVIPIEQCQTLGTVGDIVLADLGEYLMIDKGGVRADSSIHVRFIYDEMTYRFTYRCDGQPWWSAALTPKNGSNTQSPFVALATRA